MGCSRVGIRAPDVMDTVVLDVDGTLLDSNYHHVVAWSRAFERSGVRVPGWKIHSALGMGGDRLVPAVAGEDVEREHGSEIREAWEKEYDGMLDELQLLPGARALLDALRHRGVNPVLASSAIPRHAERAFELLGADRRAGTATTAEDAEESKPDPELIVKAIDRVRGSEACVVGDAVWDVEAAQRAGLPAYGLLCGGTSRAELLEAGAREVYVDPADLIAHLDDWLG
jgi:HAD superfamily hydrolase (TIGR01549 family)